MAAAAVNPDEIRQVFKIRLFSFAQIFIDETAVCFHGFDRSACWLFLEQRNS
jgi:hypothetical protein